MAFWSMLVGARGEIVMDFRIVGTIQETINNLLLT